jgi:prolyl-tRNA synthetase
LVGTIVEACHDDRGIVWPKRVAPYQVEVVSLRSKDEAMMGHNAKVSGGGAFPPSA